MRGTARARSALRPAASSLYRPVLGAGRLLLSGVIDLLYPPGCRLCREPLHAGAEHGSPFCARCRGSLLGDQRAPLCWRCAGTIGPHASTARGCVLCRRHRFAFHSVLRLGRYEGLLAEAVRRGKRIEGSLLVGSLVDELVTLHRDRLIEFGAAAVVPVPLHWRRRWARGYDQAGHLAACLARGIGVPCRPRALRRRRFTQTQSRQAPSDRWGNVRRAFELRSGEWSGRRVLLVDDVLTTGATANAAASVLRRAGAERIVVVVLARGDHLPGQGLPTDA